MGFAAGKGNKGRFDITCLASRKKQSTPFLIECNQALESIMLRHSFLTVITVKFIVLERRGGEIYWVIGKVGLGTLDSDVKFERDTNWKSISIYPDNIKWKHGLPKKS